MEQNRWHKTFPEKLSGNIRNIIEANPDGAVAKQFLCSDAEFETSCFALVDALGEGVHEAVPGLVHGYHNRVLFHSSGKCPAHCRFCFRKNTYTNRSAQQSDLTAACAYISARPEITDILISGGDPVCNSLQRLEEILTGLRSAAPGAVLRFCSRSPLSAPKLVSLELIELLQRNRPLWFVFHVNHPEELNHECVRALERLVSAGIPVVSQTVVLKGINDSVEILAELFNRLLGMGIKPYYLFQADAVEGTAGYRTDLRETLKLYGELRKVNGGLALPVAAVDLPGGGGKAVLCEALIAGKDENGYLLKREDGAIFRYPC